MTHNSTGKLACKIGFDTIENEPSKAIFLYFDIPQMSTFKYDTNGAVVVHINDCEFQLSSAHSRTASLRLSGCFQKFDRKFQTGTLSQTAEMLRLPKCYVNNMIYTIVVRCSKHLIYKLSPSPHIRM